VTSVWDDVARAGLAELADALLPGGAGLPSASAADVPATGIDRVLAERPDLSAPLLDVVLARQDRPATEYLTRLQQSDTARWTVLTTAVAAAYYMTPTVRRALGYAGQEGVLITADDFYGWAATGLLDPVLDRGPVHRPTPGPATVHPPTREAP
jgi:hypothetical protein